MNIFDDAVHQSAKIIPTNKIGYCVHKCSTVWIIDPTGWLRSMILQESSFQWPRNRAPFYNPAGKHLSNVEYVIISVPTIPAGWIMQTVMNIFDIAMPYSCRWFQYQVNKQNWILRTHIQHCLESCRMIPFHIPAGELHSMIRQQSSIPQSCRKTSIKCWIRYYSHSHKSCRMDHANSYAHLQ